jgi:hypothetical protein
MNLRIPLVLIALTLAAPSLATGKMTCDAKPEARKPIEALTADLTRQCWKVSKAKLDGGCFEVYGVTPEGDRVEAYFDPVSFEKLYVSRRGEVLYKKQ